MNVLIVYERKNRELETAIHLKLKMENMGYFCDIVQYYQVSKFNIFTTKQFDIIFVPHLYNTEEVYRTISRYGQHAHIINLQYEQVLSLKWELLGHHNPAGLARNYYHMCWGEKTKSRLEIAGIPKDKLIISGAPQLDLLDSSEDEYLEMRNYLGGMFKLPKNKKWKLFLSSFTYADISDEKLKQNEDIVNSDLSYFKNIHTESRCQLLKWFDKVLDKDKDNIFIYRPHPDEADIINVEKLASKHDNFFIIGYSSAKNWIQSSDLILSWYSTTVVESHMLNKPYAILRPLNLSDDFDSVLLKKGFFIKEYESFEEIYLSKNFTSKALMNKDVEGYYGSTDGIAVDKISSLIKQLELGTKPEKVKIPLKSYFKLVALGFLKVIYHLGAKINKDLSFTRFTSSLFEDFDSQIASKEEILEMNKLVIQKAKKRGMYV